MKTDQELQQAEALNDRKRSGRRRLLGALVGAPVIYTLPTVGATQAAGSVTCATNAIETTSDSDGTTVDNLIAYQGKLVSAHCYASLTGTHITGLGSGSDLA